MAKLALPASESAARPWSLATLVFDSLNQPLTAGVRSGASDSRQIMFEAEGTMVDFVLDSGRQSGTVSLIGQVVDKNGTKVAPRRVAVTLWTESGQPIAETSANEFGEFQLEFAPQDRLRVSVEIAGHKSIRIPPINLNGPDAMRSVT
jgi:tRNA A37 threonylcarbamoyladenosine synthetase subunit TsaC/SUA5/YrdC